MKFVDLMIFDFDGTLVDTGRDLAASVNHTLKVLDRAPRPPEEILSFVGDGIRQLIEKTLGDEERGLVEKALAIFTDHYEQHLLDNTRLYPHAEDVLKHFSGKKKVVLTNKRYYMALNIARGLGIERHFLEIVGADSTPFMKPDPQTIWYLLSKYNVSRDRAIIIGDGENDIAVAKNAGICSCACLNGLGHRQELLTLGSDYTCESLKELTTLFQ